jgi:hypothetical protein
MGLLGEHWGLGKEIKDCGTVIVDAVRGIGDVVGGL